MPTDNTGLSRRKLLRTTAIGVPAAGLLAFGSTLVTATSANAVEVDGWWGPETSAGIQRLMSAMFPKEQELFPITVDGIISAQPSDMAPYCPGIVGGWEWVDRAQQIAQGLSMGSPTIGRMQHWMDSYSNQEDPYMWIGPELIDSLHKHYGYTSVTEVSAKKYGLKPGTLPGGGGVIKGLQNEINQWVG